MGWSALRHRSAPESLPPTTRRIRVTRRVPTEHPGPRPTRAARPRQSRRAERLPLLRYPAHARVEPCVFAPPGGRPARTGSDDDVPPRSSRMGSAHPAQPWLPTPRWLALVICTSAGRAAHHLAQSDGASEGMRASGCLSQRDVGWNTGPGCPVVLEGPPADR